MTTLDGTLPEFAERRTVVFLLLGLLSELGAAAEVVRAGAQPASAPDPDFDLDALDPLEREVILLALGALSLDGLVRGLLTRALPPAGPLEAAEPPLDRPAPRPRDLFR